MKSLHKTTTIILLVALIIFVATPAFARSISLKDAGAALWIFAALGAIIILLQLIPAAILFFSFIGTITALALKGKKKAEEEVVLSATEAVPVKK